MLPDLFQEGLAGRDHAAPKDNHIRVNRVHQIGSAHRQVESRLFDNLLRHLVAGGGRVEDHFCGEVHLVLTQGPKRGLSVGFVQGLSSPPYHGSRTGVGFQASPATAAALAWIGDLNFHVPQLGPVAVFPLHHEIADDNPSPHAGTEGVKHHAVHTPAGSDPVFSKGRRVRIVLKSRGYLESIPDVLPHRHVLPGTEVGRIENEPGREVHGSRSRHADGGNLIGAEIRLGDGQANGFAHPFETERLAVKRLRRQADRAEWLAGVGDNSSLHRGAAHIQPDK